MRVVLASASPRRADLLRLAGFDFDVHPATVDETPRPRELPSNYVGRLAREKAASIVRAIPGRVVLAADTAVVVDDAILGKPADEGDAARMLTLLSGRAHDVLTGVCLATGLDAALSVETTRVWFAPLEAAEIAWYVSTGEPFDKAGGYAIQGLASRFVTRIDGSYANVVGLPVARVYQMCTAAGLLIS